MRGPPAPPRYLSSVSADPRPAAKLTLQALSELTGGEIRPQPNAPVPLHGLNTLDAAAPGELSFIGEARYAEAWAGSGATAALIDRRILGDLPDDFNRDSTDRFLVVVDNADLAMAEVLERFAVADPGPTGLEGAAHGATETHPTAVVEDGAKVGRGCRIGPGCTVAAGAVLGDGCILYANVHVYPGARLGDGCVLWPGVVIRENCRLGNRCQLHANVAIGTDGFGYRPDTSTTPPTIRKVPHLSHVEIGDDVELGAGCTIDRGKFDPTTVGHGCKFDNQVVIGHNCRIGSGVMISGNAGVAGSTTLGDFVLIGGMASIGDHLTIGAGAKLAGGIQLMHDVPAGESWAGIPGQPVKQFMRQVVATQKLPDLLRKLKKLAPDLM